MQAWQHAGAAVSHNTMGTDDICVCLKQAAQSAWHNSVCTLDCTPNHPANKTILKKKSKQDRSGNIASLVQDGKCLQATGRLVTEQLSKNVENP